MNFSRIIRAALACVLINPVVVSGQQARAGRNVNMVSGTELPGGDPYLQRQNEPSFAVSTRNPFHLMAAANDYRTVDLPGVYEAFETGDAWQGVFFSIDGGESWRSALLPGYPQDTSAEGSLSPLHGFEAVSDPVVRSGPHGLFFSSGIAFNRGVSAASHVFVARYVDLNNRENGNPIRYIDTVTVDERRPAGDGPDEFLDKPWLAVDIPRSNRRWCTIETSPLEEEGGSSVSQSLPVGNLYVAYAVISRNNDGQIRSRIDFTRSRDCGATWSHPRTLSLPTQFVNQGATIAMDPTQGTVYIAWRQFGLDVEGQRDAIHVVRSEDGGERFSLPFKVRQLPANASLQRAWRDELNEEIERRSGHGPQSVADITAPFDQPTLPRSSGGDSEILFRAFRFNAYPTMTVDADSRVYIAWSELGHGPGIDPSTGDPGDARIVLTTSRHGIHWNDEPIVVDEPRDEDGVVRRGHQIMPSLVFAGHLFLAYYDFRDDAIESEGPSPFIVDPILPSPEEALLRHTVDVRAAMAEPGPRPVFTNYEGGEGTESDRPIRAARVSRFIFAADRDNPGRIGQTQTSQPNLPLFDSGRVPFHGDYIDWAPSPAMKQDEHGRWHFDSDADSARVAHLAWADNRDVIPPPDGDWTTYEPPSSTQPAPFASPSYSGVLDVCSERTGMRNQNIYTSRITEGLVVGSPGNTKPLGETTLNSGESVLIQRAFVAFVRNTTDVEKSYRLTILDQPPDFDPAAPGAAGEASFLQFEHQETLDAAIPPFSSISRPVFVKSIDEDVSLRVLVQETDTPGGLILTEGLKGLIELNPDVLNPEILNPEILNPEQSTEDLVTEEVHNPEILNPEILNPEILNPEILNPEILTPEILNPEIINPEILNPEILNPEILNPEILNPEILNPEILNPEILNAASTGGLTEITWTLRNDGNTTSSFAARTFIENGAPEGFKFQLLVYRIHTTPAVNLLDCRLETDPNRQRQHHELLVDIRNPEILNPEILNPEILNPEILNPSPDIATFYVAPGDSVRITLRALDPDVSDDVVLDTADVFLATVAHSVDTEAAASGAVTPVVDVLSATPLAIINASTLPAARAGVVYNETLTTEGGDAPFSWSLTDGTLPQGLSLDASTGTVSGTTVQNFPESLTVASDGNPGDQFGVVSVDGDTLIVGAPTVETSQGSAYIFERVGGAWQELKKLDAGSLLPGDFFGGAVTVHGDIAVVGAPSDDGVASNSGTAYVFGRDEGGADNWGLVKELTPSDLGPNYNFGITVALSTDTLVVGSWVDSNLLSAAGAAYVYERNSGGLDNWGQVKKLVASDVEQTAFFGNSAAIDGDTIVIGSLGKDEGLFNNVGAAYLFQRDQGGPDNWGRAAKLLPDDVDSRRNFGVSVAIDGDMVIVGAYDIQSPGGPGAAYLYQRDAGGVGAWGQIRRLQAIDMEADAEFGIGVSVRDGTALVGARADDAVGPDSGAAYLFERDHGGVDQWRQVSKIIPTDATVDDQFGSFTAVMGDRLIVSTLGRGGSRGAVYEFVEGSFEAMLSVIDSGTPQQEATSPLSFRVTDPLVIGTSSLPNASLASPFSFELQAGGGVGFFSWSLVSGALPAGLTLDPATGVISGVPLATGAFPITVRVEDESSPTQSAEVGVVLSVL